MVYFLSDVPIERSGAFAKVMACRYREKKEKTFAISAGRRQMNIYIARVNRHGETKKKKNESRQKGTGG